MVYIQSINKLQTTRAKGKKKDIASKTEGMDFNNYVDNIEPPANNPMHMSNISSLILLNDIPSHQTAIEKNFSRAENIIKKLEDFRNNLLLKKINLAELKEIKSIIDQRREFVNDEKLNQLLMEIELRAAVEIAKFGL